MATSVTKPSERRQKPDEAPVPKPPGFKCKPEKFFPYWESLFPAYKDRITVYVYRMWPVIDREKNSKRKYIDKLAEPITRDDMPHRYGDGDYAMHLTDGNREICRTAMHGRDGIRNYAPPVIDVKDLVMDDPANASYIETLRSQGILPREKGDDMATVAAMSEMTSGMVQMVGKVLENKNSTASSEQAAASRSIELISSTASKVVDMVRDQAGGGGPNQSIDMLDKAANIIERLAPKESGGGLRDVMPLIQVALEQSKAAHEVQLTFLSDRLKFTETMLLTQQQQQQQSGGKSLIGELKQLADLKETLQDVFGGPPEQQQKDEPGLIKYMPYAVAGLSILGTIVYNLTVAKTGNGTPIKPEVPQIPSADQTKENQPQPTAQEDEVYRAFLREIEIPLLSSLRSGEDGGKFAATLIGLKGEFLYQQLQKAGKDQLLALLQMDSTLYQQLTADPKFPQFLDQFLAGPTKE